MSSPSASDVKVFVPAKDFSRSLAFYEALGWNTIWRAEDDSLALIELAAVDPTFRTTTTRSGRTTSCFTSL